DRIHSCSSSNEPDMSGNGSPLTASVPDRGFSQSEAYWAYGRISPGTPSMLSPQATRATETASKPSDTAGEVMARTSGAVRVMARGYRPSSVCADEIRVSHQEVHNVARGAQALALDGFKCAAAHVGCDEDVVDLAEWMIGGRRLVLED